MIKQQKASERKNGINIASLNKSRNLFPFWQEFESFNFRMASLEFIQKADLPVVNMSCPRLNQVRKSESEVTKGDNGIRSNNRMRRLLKDCEQQWQVSFTKLGARKKTPKTNATNKGLFVLDITNRCNVTACNLFIKRIYIALFQGYYSEVLLARLKEQFSG